MSEVRRSSAQERGSPPGAAGTPVGPVSTITAPIGIEGPEASLAAEAPGRYVLERELARGGQGVVYLAQDTQLGRAIAFKVLLRGAGAPPDSLSPAEARFVREARLTAQLDHPGIAPIHEVGRRPGGELYVAQKLVRGRTLASSLAACTSVRERLGLIQPFLAICQAVAYAHDRA